MAAVSRRACVACEVLRLSECTTVRSCDEIGREHAFRVDTHRRRQRARTPGPLPQRVSMVRGRKPMGKLRPSPRQAKRRHALPRNEGGQNLVSARPLTTAGGVVATGRGPGQEPPQVVLGALIAWAVSTPGATRLRWRPPWALSRSTNRPLTRASGAPSETLARLFQAPGRRFDRC